MGGIFGNMFDFNRDGKLDLLNMLWNLALYNH